jgi:phosphonatase-like hydrolase
MAIKLAVFDIAGTTVADENNVDMAFQKAFAKNGIEIDPGETNALMGYHKPLAISMMLEKLGYESDPGFIDEIHEDFENEMIDFYEYADEVKALPGAEDIFLWLKEKGVRIALNTGFSDTIARTILDRFQWQEKGLVDDFIGSNEVEEGRPSPFMIHELMKRAGIDDPNEVIKIGDTIVDIEEGRNAGCLYVIGVTTGACNKEELEEYNPTHVINNLSELASILY